MSVFLSPKLFSDRKLRLKPPRRRIEERKEHGPGDSETSADQETRNKPRVQSTALPASKSAKLIPVGT